MLGILETTIAHFQNYIILNNICKKPIIIDSRVYYYLL